MGQIVPTPPPPGRSRFGWLSMLAVILVFLGMLFPPTRSVAVALLVAGLLAYVLYMLWKSRQDPRALEKEIKSSDDNVVH